MNHRYALPLALAAAGLAACGDDDGGPVDLSEAPICAVDANFASIYDRLLSTGSCAGSGCHDAVSQSAGLNFQKTASEVYADMFNVASTSVPTKVRIVANDSAASYFHEKLVNPMPGGALGRMPPGGEVEGCVADAIAEWIDAGATAPTCAIQPTFSSIYTGVLSTNTCASGGCHDAGAAAGLNFQKPPAELLNDLVGIDSISVPSKVRVVAGDASASYFHEKLVNPDPGGALGRMPPGGELPSCEAAAVAVWINSGATNN